MINSYVFTEVAEIVFDYFVSSSTGDDSNDGLTPETAWETLDKVATSDFSPGDIIGLKAGDTWEEAFTLSNSDWGGTVGNPVIITAYGVGNKPIITSHIEQSLTWSDQGSNVWRTTVTNEPNRVEYDGTELLRGVGTESIGDDIGDTVGWTWSSNNLDIYSTDNPNLHIVKFSTEGQTIYLDREENITLDGLNIQGGTDYGLLNYSTNNLIIRNCEIGAWSNYALSLQIVGGGVPEGNIIEDNIIDSKWTLDYSECTKDDGTYQGRGAYEGIRVSCANNFIIRNNVVKDWQHANFSLTSASAIDTSTGISNGKIYGNECSGENVYYGGKVAMDRAVFNIEWYNNFFHDIPNENSFNGWNNHIHDNIFLRISRTPLRTTAIGRAVSLQGYAGEVYGNIIENNVMIDCDGPGMYISNSHNYDCHDNTFRNNIAYNCGLDDFYTDMGIVYRNGNPATYDNTFQNNIIYSDNTETTVHFVGTDMTVDTFNGQTTYGTVASNNLSDDPLFVNDASDWHLQAGSPAINSGVPTISNVDYFGNTRPYLSSKADIGIHEYPDEGEPDVTPPTLISAVIQDAEPTEIVLTFDDYVTGSNLGFTIDGTTSTSFDSVSGTGLTYIGVLADAAEYGETITLSYNSGTGDFTDLSNNALATITDRSVTNNVEEYIPPSNLIVNGTFDVNADSWSGNDATLAAVSGELVITSTGTNSNAIQYVVGLEAGKTYRVTLDAIQGTNQVDYSVRFDGFWFRNGATDFGTGLTFDRVYSGNNALQLYGDYSLNGGHTAIYDNITVIEVENP